MAESPNLNMSPSSYGKTPIRSDENNELSSAGELNFAEKFYGAGKSFVETLKNHYEKYDEFTDRLMKYLEQNQNTSKLDEVFIEDYDEPCSSDRYPYIPTLPNVEETPLSDENIKNKKVQTDNYFKEFCDDRDDDRDEYVKNQKTIEFLQREIELYKKITMGNETDRMLAKNIKFYLYITNTSESKDKNKENCLNFNETLNIVELKPLHNSYLPPLYYKFDNVFKSSDEESSKF